MERKRPQKIDKNKLRKILETEDEFISTLFDCFEVPESKEGTAFYTTDCYFIFQELIILKYVEFFVHIQSIHLIFYR